MLVVLHHSLTRIHIELRNLLVAGTHKEEILLVILGVEFETERVFLELKGAHYFAVLGIPIVNGLVEACA